MKKLFILLCFIFLVPIIILSIYSFSFNWIYPNLIPKEFTLRGIEAIFTFETIKVTLNSIFSSLIVTSLTLVLCIPTARALAFANVKFKSIFTILFTSPLILPMASITMGIHLLFIKLHITNSLIGIVLINTIPCIPYGVRLIVNTMKSVGKDYELVAQNLGASSYKAFFKITFPLLMPGIVSAFTFLFSISFSQYFTTFLIGGGKFTTLPIVMIPYIQSGDRTLSSAYSLLFIFSSLIVLLIFEKIIEKYYKKSQINVQFNI